ncbi:MAG TPA: hypothetical protein VFC32_12525 [Pseudolabrys sp.]|nr:hypothetical protein [Pseudolabrys sp.]
MRILLIAAAATLLMLPATRQANACEDAMPSAQVTTTEYSAEADKKPVKKVKKAKHHKKKEKVEYMRAAPMK